VNYRGFDLGKKVKTRVEESDVVRKARGKKRKIIERGRLSLHRKFSEGKEE